MSKTVLLIRNAAPGDFGGAETYQVSLASVLSGSDYEPIIVSRSSKLLEYAKQHDIATVRSWWLSRQGWSGAAILLTPLYIAWQLLLVMWYLRLIVRTKAEVLHIQSRDDFIAATLAGRLLKRHVVWTDHMDLRYVFMNLTRRLRNPVGKLVFWAGRFSDHIILISQNEYRLVTGQFRRPQDLARQITVINNGVIDRRDSYQRPAVASDTFSYCLASRMVTNKGVGDAIDAFKSLNLTDVELRIYGDGAELEDFKARAADTPAIRFYGHQADAQANVLAADVFMLPSYQEGFSIALLEATMLQKTIIASDVDSNPEIITNGESGLLVAPHDVTGLAKAMRRLYDDRALGERLALQARKNYEQNFDLAKIVSDKIVPLYTKSGAVTNV